MPKTKKNRPPVPKQKMSDLLPVRITEFADVIAREIEEPVRNEFQLPQKDWRVLRVLANNGALPPAEISRIGGQNKAQTSRALKCLFDRELVFRQAHPEDDRTFLVSLTKEGETMVRVAVKKMRQRQTAFLRTLPAKQQTQLQSFLSNLDSILEE